jgi:hypothetical protein
MPTAGAHSVGVRSRCWPLAANNRAENVTLYSQREIRINGSPNRKHANCSVALEPEKPVALEIGQQIFRHACVCPYTINASSMRHNDPSITLRVYAHWVPDASITRAVDLLDDAQASATPGATDAAAAGMEKCAMSRWGNGDPKFRQLEPHSGLAQAA